MLFRTVVATLLLALAAPLSAAVPEIDLAPAKALFDAKDFAGAAEAYGDAAARYAARYQQSETQRYYCAEGGPQALLYMAMAATDKVSAMAVGTDWCEALFLQAYSYVELGRVEEALAPLQSATELDPYNAQYANELAFVLVKLGKFDEGMASYRTALSVAGSFDQPPHRKAVALRGIGWIHADRRQWDEAERAFRESLEIEPGNENALSELRYIEQNRPRH